MAKFITEVLQDLNDNIQNVDQYKDNAALKSVLAYAFLPQNKFILPEGTPPFKKDVAPQGMSLSNFYQEIRRFYIFLRADLTPMKRESLFISMLEGLHPDESEVMILIKDQNLTSKYSNITPTSIASLLV